MDMLMTEFPAAARFDRSALLVQSAFCALPLAIIVIARAASLFF
jgi:hypothetical protein